MSRASERKLERRHAHTDRLDDRRPVGSVPADQLRSEQARLRHLHRPARSAPKKRPRWDEQIGIGATVMERMVSEPGAAKDKPAKPNRVAVPCTCDPQRDHGPHWITPTEDEQAAIKEAA